MISLRPSLLVRHIKYLPGWRTNRKIIVIESDDWGSIRMPSKDVYNKCLKQGYRVDNNIFSKYDSLASESDLTNLFDLLLKFKDFNGNHPIITANCLTSNPDFEKIKQSNYKEYYFESIKDTFNRYPKHSQCFDLWKAGKDAKLFFPQFHGREHLNVSRFMNDLRSKNQDALFAFENEMPGIFEKDNVLQGNNYVVALEHHNKADREEKAKIISSGLQLFEELFSFKSSSFIATNHVWPPELDATTSNFGVKYLQGSYYQLIPKGNYKGFKKKYHYLGQKNKYHQLYLVRNVHFEPSLSRNADWVASALKQIELNFKWSKPAIISMHRINFVGFIDESNRDISLKLLENLLNSIILKYPDVEFLTTDQLGSEINS